MKRALTEIFVLIMLECRLSFYEACEMFRMAPLELQSDIENFLPPHHYKIALDFLRFETLSRTEENKRGKFKANFYLRRLNKILKITSKEARVSELNSFITDLSGPDISFVLQKSNRRYTEEEKMLIQKYRIKYAITTRQTHDIFGIDDTTLADWARSMEDGQLKSQIETLNDFGRGYYGRKRKRND